MPSPLVSSRHPHAVAEPALESRAACADDQAPLARRLEPLDRVVELVGEIELEIRDFAEYALPNPALAEDDRFDEESLPSRLELEVACP